MNQCAAVSRPFHLKLEKNAVATIAIIDMDEATPNKPWVDISGDVSPTGIWYFQVTAYNNRCPAQTAEGPF